MRNRESERERERDRERERNERKTESFQLLNLMKYTSIILVLMNSKFMECRK